MHFPILSWPLELSGSLDVSVDGVIETIDMATSSPVWSWASETDGSGSSDSLAVHLGNRFLTHSRVTAVSDTLYKGLPEALEPEWRVYLTTTPASGLFAFKSNAGDPFDLPSIGFNVTIPSWTISSSTATVISREHWAGIWHAGVELSSQRRPKRWVFEDAESPYDAAARDGIVYSMQQDVRLFWEAVDDAHLRAHRAADAEFADMAGRSEDDRYNVIEDLLEAMVRQKTIRIYWGHGDYTECAIRAGGAVTSIEDLVTDNPDDPHRYAVTVPLAVLAP